MNMNTTKPQFDVIIRDFDHFDSTGKMIIGDPSDKDYKKNGWIGNVLRGRWSIQVGYVGNKLSFVEVWGSGMPEGSVEVDNNLGYYKLTDIETLTGLVCITDYVNDSIYQTSKQLVEISMYNDCAYIDTGYLPPDNLGSLHGIATVAGCGKGKYAVYALNDIEGKICMLQVQYMSYENTD